MKALDLTLGYLLGPGHRQEALKASKVKTSQLCLFEGVCLNYRHPDPRRGEPRVGSAPHVAFPGDPVDPVDPLDSLQNSVRLIFNVK